MITPAVLTIKWQRLLSDGKTCPRCGATETGVDSAAAKLKLALFPLGIEVRLEKAALSQREFKKDPLRSNTILLNGKPLEDYLAAAVGQSKCCDVCGPEDCRTVVVSGKTYETIPAELIVKAGLMAAASLVVPSPQGSCCGN